MEPALGILTQPPTMFPLCSHRGAGMVKREEPETAPTAITDEEVDAVLYEAKGDPREAIRMLRMTSQSGLRCRPARLPWVRERPPAVEEHLSALCCQRSIDRGLQAHCEVHACFAVGSYRSMGLAAMFGHSSATTLLAYSSMLACQSSGLLKGGLLGCWGHRTTRMEPPSARGTVHS